ncbi:MAG TPA: glycosyltransferase family 39 protein [Gemmatimonadaceae bacterium]|nr:glycosyltransferase family 39 protein [Gemmatimonadaceae bacterium]
MSRRWGWALALLLPVLCAAAFRRALPASMAAGENTDFATFYSPVAHRILAGDGITTESGAVAMRYPPGYPILLAAAVGAGGAIGLSDARSMDMLTLLCIGLSSLLLYLVARDLFSGWLALAPSLAYATYPLGLWLTRQPSSEVPFTTLLFACAWLAWRLTRGERPHWALAAVLGALAGAAMLVRPIGVFMPLVLAALVLLLAAKWPARTRALAAAAIVAASALVIAPWEVHVSRAAGRFVLLSDGGVPSMRDGLTFAVNASKGRAPIWVPDGVRTVMISFLAQYDQLDSYGAIARAGAKEFAAHPGGMIGLAALKLARAWYGTDSQRLDRYILLLQLFYIAALAWAMRMAWRAGGERRRLAIIAGAFLLYFWGMSVLALPLVRYMVPAIGLAFLVLPAAVERHRLA